ncbi:uncharacterized protein LOC144039009 [Vanacampus margaritifer]
MKTILFATTLMLILIVIVEVSGYPIHEEKEGVKVDPSNLNGLVTTLFSDDFTYDHELPNGHDYYGQIDVDETYPKGGVEFYPPDPDSDFTYPRGVTICLRYCFDHKMSPHTIFTLGRFSQTPLTLKSDNTGAFWLSTTTWTTRLGDNQWSGVRDKDGQWNRMCLVVYPNYNITMFYRGSSEKYLAWIPEKYVFTGEPVIAMYGPGGHVTDLQMWDYPSVDNTYQYMTNGNYEGSVLKWSNLRYRLTGASRLELYPVKCGNQQPQKEDGNLEGTWREP